jgi:hypothetical protein
MSTDPRLVQVEQFYDFHPISAQQIRLRMICRAGARSKR